MAGIRVELLVVLFGTLLLVSGRGWRPINESHLHRFYQTGQWGDQSFTTSDNSNTFNSEENGYTINSEDEEDELIPEDAMPDFEGAATSDRFDPFADHGYQEEVGDFGPRQWVSGSDGGFQIEFDNTPPMSWTSSTQQSSSGLTVVCSGDEFQITLPTDNFNDVKVLGSKDQPIMNAPGCGYDVNHLTNTLTVPFSGCNVIHADEHSLRLSYVDELGQTQVATASCEESLNFDFVPRSNDKPQKKHNCPNPTPGPIPGPTTGPSKAQNCPVTTGERVTCGQSGISSADCLNMGCCFDSSTSACYYPMDECTGDQHFVFAIRYNAAAIQVDPTKLVIPGTNCKPVIVNDRVAIYKFKVTECGTKAYQVGDTKIYLAEVQTIVQALNLKFGVITRTDPLRFMVECRYGKEGTPNKALASIGYMVLTPDSDLPKSVVSNGLYGVQLKIAKDQTYSSYEPTYHQPLRLLLGKPIYLELSLKSPKPDAVILVNYCLAYPRSAKNALVLVYEGCANPYDPNVSILKVSDLPTNRHQRRFVVKAFQFMDQKTNKYLEEEIYFMCSAEVCRPKEKTCEQRCFDGKAP